MIAKKKIDLGEYSIIGWDKNSIEHSGNIKKIKMYVTKHLSSGKLLHIHELGGEFYVDNFNHATFAIEKFWEKYKNNPNYQIIPVVV